jgi:hypothetical protein
MEQMVCMKPNKRSNEKPKFKKISVNDTRFGRRSFFLSELERPMIHVPQLPGRDQHTRAQ